MSDPPEITRASDDRAADRPFPARLANTSSGRPRIIELNSPHAPKFRLATGFLLGIAVAALGLAVALASHGSSNAGSRPWSSWKPTTGGKIGASQIAEHVAPYYRLTSAAQLDVVTLISLSNPNAQGPGTSSGLTVAVNTGAPGSTSSLSLLSGSTIAYNLCGVGSQNCQLPGTPSSGRMLLLRREALELALYTFKYVGGVSNVICVLPPSHELFSTLSSHLPSTKSLSSSSQPVTTAVVFLRQELEPWLRLPLGNTLQAFPHRFPNCPRGRTLRRPGSWIRSPPTACSLSRSSLSRRAGICWCSTSFRLSRRALIA